MDPMGPGVLACLWSAQDPELRRGVAGLEAGRVLWLPGSGRLLLLLLLLLLRHRRLALLLGLAQAGRSIRRSSGRILFVVSTVNPNPPLRLLLILLLPVLGLAVLLQRPLRAEVPVTGTAAE